MTAFDIVLSAITLVFQIYAFFLLTEISPIHGIRSWLRKCRDQRRLRQGWTREIFVSEPSSNGNVAVGFRWVPPTRPCKDGNQ